MTLGGSAFGCEPGTGPAYDNNWAPITTSPDGPAYIGVINGIVAVRDRG
ncbi:hypothetical protein [Streptomyces sp. HUAS TT7]